jgi:hypothetical protein
MAALSTEVMARIIRDIMAGKGADPAMPPDEMQFWQTTAAEIAALPPGMSVDIPGENEVGNVRPRKR